MGLTANKKLLLACLLPLLIVEILARVWDADTDWYYGTQKSRESAQKIVFLGTSRTQAAVIGDLVAEKATRALGRKIVVQNFGSPHGSSVAHCLGLRKMLAENPDYLRGTMVAMESCGSFPCNAGGWRDNWILSDIPTPDNELFPLLSISDLPDFWKSKTPDNFKALTSISLLFHCVRSISRMNNFIASTGDFAVNRFLMSVRQVFVPKPEPLLHSLRDERGIVVDEARTNEIRTNMVKRVLPQNRKKVSTQVPFLNLDEMVDRDLVDLVRKNGGTFLYYNVPQSEIDSMIFETKIGRQNGERFTEKAAGWGASVNSIDFAFQQNEFPDLLHVSAPTGVRYTNQLFEEILLPRLRLNIQREISGTSENK